jgi:uncharacterized membrane protein YeaQ/YmgE (transglycosylase-associated protein family)
MFFGLIVGILAKLLTPGHDPGGFFVTILLGMIGAGVGGWLGRVIGIYGPDQPVGLFMAMIGAIILLVGYRTLSSGENTRHA